LREACGRSNPSDNNIIISLSTALTSDGALGYLADVHRDGGSDSADNSSGNQTGHVQFPDGGREVYHCPADDERHRQGCDGGLPAEYVRTLASRYGPDDGTDGDQRTDPRPLVGRYRDPRVLGLQHGQHRRCPRQHRTHGERSDRGCNEKKRRDIIILLYTAYIALVTAAAAACRI